MAIAQLSSARDLICVARAVAGGSRTRVNRGMSPPHQAGWTRCLAARRTEPLEFCPHLPEIAARWERWWNFSADRPFTIPTCDFTALIGSDDFKECCLPSLHRQAEIAGRLLFHLDGPQAARHAPTLAAQPWITAVQYTPGAGTPSALAKLDLFRSLQAAGKPVLVITPKEEVAQLARSLDPRATAILVEDKLTPAEADALADAVARVGAA